MSHKVASVARQDEGESARRFGRATLAGFVAGATNLRSELVEPLHPTAPSGRPRANARSAGEHGRAGDVRRALLPALAFAAAAVGAHARAQDVLLWEAAPLPFLVAEAPSAPGVLGLGVRGLPPVTHLALQPVAPYASSHESGIPRRAHCHAEHAPLDVSHIAPPRLPSVALPAISLPALCPMKAEVTDPTQSAARPGAPCPPESFAGLVAQCAFESGDSLAVRQSSWLWSSNAQAGSIGLPVVLRVFWRN